MRISFLFLFFSNIFIFLFSNTVMGATADFTLQDASVDDGPFSNAAPDFYQMTFEELEFCTDATCTTPTKVCTAALTFDITSVSAGSDIGSWCSLAGLPLGTTYTHLRLVINRSFVMRGSVENITISSVDYDCSTKNVTMTGTTFGGGAITADADPTTPVNQTLILLSCPDIADDLTLADGSTYGCSYTNGSDGNPDGTVSWCFGSTSSHAMSNAQCTAANTTGSPTWVNNANADHFQIIFALPTSYTVGVIAPKLTIKVAESKTLEVILQPEDGNATCNFQPGNPIFTFGLVN